MCVVVGFFSSKVEQQCITLIILLNLSCQLQQLQKWSPPKNKKENSSGGINNTKWHVHLHTILYDNEPTPTVFFFSCFCNGCNRCVFLKREKNLNEEVYDKYLNIEWWIGTVHKKKKHILPE